MSIRCIHEYSASPSDSAPWAAGDEVTRHAQLWRSPIGEGARCTRDALGATESKCASFLWSDGSWATAGKCRRQYSYTPTTRQYSSSAGYAAASQHGFCVASPTNAALRRSIPEPVESRLQVFWLTSTLPTMLSAAIMATMTDMVVVQRVRRVKDVSQAQSDDCYRVRQALSPLHVRARSRARDGQPCPYI